MGRTLKTLDGVSRADLTVLDCTEQGIDTTWKVIREIWGTQKVLFFEINRLWKRP